MKPQDVRKNTLSFKTTDAVLNFLQLASQQSQDTISTEIHKLCDRARRTKSKKSVGA